MVTGWSYLSGSNGVLAACSSCTTAFPRDVTRIETWSGLPSFIAGMSGTRVTGPSQSPANVFMVSNAFCASDGNALSAGLCASECASATVESDITTNGAKRKGFTIILLEKRFPGVSPSAAPYAQGCYLLF